MEWLQQVVRKELWQFNAYSSARSEVHTTDGLVQMDANENPYPPYPLSVEAAELNRYPEPQPQWLLQRLASIYATEPERIMVGRGMDEIIDVVLRLFCTAYQDKILITPPTYGMYQVAALIQGVSVVEVPLSADDGFQVPVAEVITKAKTEQVKVIFLCTPNNPSGNLIPLTAIEVIARSLPHTIIAVDEAYLEFALVPSAITLQAQLPNVVVMRTLSKAYAAAGLRLGSIVAAPEIIGLLRKILAPYPLTQPCLRLARQLLSAHGLHLMKERLNLLISERGRIERALAHAPQVRKIYPSSANFILFKVADANSTYQQLLAKGILVRNRQYEVENSLRLSVGTPEQNDLLLSALGAISQPSSAVYRQATVVRNTNETKIMLTVNLDLKEPIEVKTGIGFFDHMLEQLAKHGSFSLALIAAGDTHIDYHHTVEDVAITLGQALRQALGDKRGIERYGFVLPMDESLASASLDLSGRGILVYDAKFTTPLIGDFPVELVQHFFLSFAEHLQAALHLSVTGQNAHHMAEGLFKACAKVLRQAISKTGTSVPSTKGVL